MTSIVPAQVFLHALNNHWTYTKTWPMQIMFYVGIHLYIGTLQFLSRGFCISKLYGCSFAMIVVDVSLASFVFSFDSVPQGL